MIIIKFSGGLGNQLYQYAFFRLLCQKHPQAIIKADISNYKLYDVHQGYELDRIFAKSKEHIVPIANMGEQFFNRGEIPVLCGKRFGKALEIPIAWFNARSRKWFKKRKKVYYIDEEYINEQYSGREKALYIQKKVKEIDDKHNWYISGYWQDEQIYDVDLSSLSNQLEFPPLIDEINLMWKEKIETSNSVSIHVRRGDYVGTKFDVVTMEYYRNAVEYIKKYVDRPVFFVFSEDEKYIENEFKWLENKYVISNNRGMDSYKDMQLMSLCKHNIIANSTFSEWSAYLNRNKNKLVIYPDTFSQGACKCEKSGKNWKKMDGRGR